MNFYTIQQLRADLDSALHSGGVSQLQDFYKTVDKGRRQMIGKVRPEELIRKGYLEQALYPHVDRYAPPEDLKYDDVIDITMLAGYRNVDTLNQPLMSVYRRRYDQKRYGSRNVVNVGYENGVKYVRIHKPVRNTGRNGNNNSDQQHLVINDCDSLTANGTWNVGGNVVNLKVDELNHVIGHASLSFDINNSATSGFIENFTLTAFDINDFLNKGATFAWLDLPIPKEMTSVKLTLGSDPNNLLTDLYTSTVNQPHDNNEFTTGWNLLKFMMNNLNVVGTPNPKNMIYIRFDFTTTGVAIPNCHLDNIVARLGTVFEITYNSPWCFMDTASKAWKKIPTANSDIIVAEEDTYQILLLETTLAAQKEIYGSAAGAKSDIQDTKNDLDAAYNKFKEEHKSEALMTEDSTYIFGNYLEGNWSDQPQSAIDDYSGDSQTQNQP